MYNWFTEGFDTADLKDAKTLLDELEWWRPWPAFLECRSKGGSARVGSKPENHGSE